MGGVWWRPEPCRCLSIPFSSCLDASVPAPSFLYVARWVRVVSAAVIPGSSGFFDTSRLLAFLRLPVFFSRMLLSGADGCPHTVVVLKFIFLCFLFNSCGYIFWAEILLYGYSSLGGELDIRLSGLIRTFMRQESCGCAHTVWSLASVMSPVVGFFAPSPTVSSSWNRASSWIRRLQLQARCRVTLPPNNPFHPGHLPAVGWAYIIFYVSIDFIALF